MNTPLKTPVLALGATLALLLLAGCANRPEAGGYVGANEAQQRQAAGEEATRPQANIDTLQTYLKLVAEMQQNDLWFASLAHIDALEQRWGVSPASIRLRADALRQAGQPAESEAAYKRLMGTAFESNAWHGLGLLAGGRGDFAEAARLLERARQLKPADPLLLSDLGYALLRGGKAGEARLPLMKAFQLRPDNQQAQVNLALYFEANGEAARATTLMDGNNMPAATRDAIRAAARQLNTSLPPLPASATPVALAVVAPAPAPAPVAALSPVLALAPVPAPVAEAVAAAEPAPAPADAGNWPLALKASRWSSPPPEAARQVAESILLPTDLAALPSTSN